MKRFAKFAEDLFKNRYEVLLEKIINEKIPCAFFNPFLSLKDRDRLIKNLLDLGINLRYLIYFQDFVPLEFDCDVEAVSIKDIFTKQPKPEIMLLIEHPMTQFICGYREKLEAVGIDTVVLSETTNESNKYFNTFISHLSDIYEVYEQLTDEISRESMLGYFLARSSQKMNYLQIDNSPQYFLNGYMPKSGDILIDGGAYDGASAATFTEHGCQVYAFEMDEANYQAAVELSKKHKFTLENYGLGSYRRNVRYIQYYSSSSVAKSDDETLPIAKIISIDEYVAEHHIPRVDFIKLDVEGSELDVLKGATQTLLRFKPKLALSAYHKPEDVWTLIQFIKSVRSDYEFAFRHYAIDLISGKIVFNDDLKHFYEFCEIYPHAESCCELVIHAR